MGTELEALRAAIDALEEIALAGMSGSGQESEEGMRDWHARRAWEFIGIAARALEPAREGLRAAQAAGVKVCQTIVVECDDAEAVARRLTYNEDKSQAEAKHMLFVLAGRLRRAYGITSAIAAAPASTPNPGDAK